MKMHKDNESEVMRRYIFKVHPTPAQAAVFDTQRRMIAELWNALKQRCEDVWRREHRLLSYFDMTSEITQLRRELPEWRALPCLSAYRVAKALAEAYAAFFRRLKAGDAEAGYPRWHAAAKGDAIPLGVHGSGWQLRRRPDQPQSWRLHYKSVSDIRAPQSWLHCRGRLPGEARDWRTGDLVLRAGRWWLSVCVALAPRRRPGRRPIRIELDLVDAFARVNGKPVFLPALFDAAALEIRLDQLKRERDLAWPRGRRRQPDEERDFAADNLEIARLAARIARIRKNALHVWTTQIVAQASALELVAPEVRRHTRSSKGDAKNWGSHTKTVAALNRNALGQAPANAVAMLVYKAAEAGITCTMAADPAPPIALGQAIGAAGRAVRRMRREIKARKEAA